MIAEIFDQIRQREIRLNGQSYYNYKCRTERFRNSRIAVYAAIVYSIDLYDKSLSGC